MTVPKEQAWLFWEVDPSRIDLDRDEDYVIARVIEFGRLVDIRWLLGRYDLERIHRFFREVGHPELSARTIAFWRALFRADEGAEKEQWASPPAFRRSKSIPWPA